MTEIWAPIEGYEELYSISSEGRIRALRTGKLMAAVTISDGYLGVKLFKNGKPKTARVHTLVCAAFHGPKPTPRHQVGHQDGSRTNNRFENLKWMTPAENTAQKREHGTHQAGERHPRARLTISFVQAIRASKAPRKQLAAEYGVSQWTIKEIRGGKRWKEARQPGDEVMRPEPDTATPSQQACEAGRGGVL